MNFDLTEDEEMLKALAERFVTDNYDFEKRIACLAEPHGYCQGNWALLGELGLIAALFDESDGGLGLGATSIATIFETLGCGLVVEPLGENILLAGRLFAAGASDALRAARLQDVVAGTTRLALACAERRSRPGRLWIEAGARADGGQSGGQYRLSGAKTCVPAGAGADAYIVAARTHGAADDADGVGLFVVPANSPGLTIRPWRMIDGSAAVWLDLDAVAVDESHRLTGGWTAVEQAEDFANLGRAAEALGIMERIFAETLDYLNTREQFGVRLGSFQALQHRMAAQYAVLEQSRGLLHLALVHDGRAGFAQAIRGLRAFIAPASVTLGHEMVQMHGGMGITDELSIGHAYKRLLALSRWPDSPEAAMDRYARAA